MPCEKSSPILMERELARVEKAMDPGVYVLSMMDTMSLNF